MSEVQNVITAVYDAVNDTNVHIAAGTIERINIKRINEDGSPKVTNINKGPNAGKSIVATHRASLLLKNGEDQQWISFGTHEVKNLKYENQYQIKVDDKWTDLKEGMVIRVPVQIRKWTDGEGKERSGAEGKKAKIKITDASGARESKPAGASGGSQQAPTASSASSGKTTKVYGDIVSVSGSDVVVSTEAGQVTVKLSEEQLGQIQSGGRLAGQRADDGTLTGFKTYGPKGAGAGQGTSGSSKAGYKKDNSGMETGHALNGALNLRRIGLTMPPVVEVAKVVHDVTKQLKTEAGNDPANKGMSEYDLGAMVGHAVLNATRDVQVGNNDNPEEISDKLMEYSRALLKEVVPGVSAYVKGVDVPENQSQQQGSKPAEPTQPDPKTEVVNNPTPPAEQGRVNMTPPELDFDDDIPF